MRHRASNYGLQCQSAYKQMYGEKKDPGRRLDPTARSADDDKPKLNRIRKGSGGNTGYLGGGLYRPHVFQIPFLCQSCLSLTQPLQWWRLQDQEVFSKP